jgi:hypothetical protein
MALQGTLQRIKAKACAGMVNNRSNKSSLNPRLASYFTGFSHGGPVVIPDEMHTGLFPCF